MIRHHWILDSGITFEPALPYTQHKNGVSERMIQTHNVKARAMMLDSRLPANLWAEAINTANYLHARSPTAANKGLTPYEKLYGSKPIVTHLHRFGCTAYRMLPVPQRHGKFGSRAEIVYMLGYMHDSTTIWRFWDPERKRVIQASNVRFDELAEMHELERMRTESFRLEHEDADTASIAGAEDASNTGAEDASNTGAEDASNTGAPRVADASAPQVAEAGASRVADASAPQVAEAGAPQVADAGASQRMADGPQLGQLGSYNLRKRPRALLAHRTWVEEESDAADSVSYRMAVEHPRLARKWSEAVQEELQSLDSNSTWEYVRLEDVPAGDNPISSKWVFKTKLLPGGGIRYKARLVIRGFEQTPGVNFDETFAPVAKLTSLRMLLARAAIRDWEFEQMDVVTAFLNSELVDDDVYMEMPEGMVAPAG